MKKIIIACMALAIAPAFAQSSVYNPMDVLERAHRSADSWWSNTLDNARKRADLDQIQEEDAWFNRCMYQTGGDVNRCRGIGRSNQQGELARLVERGDRIRSITNIMVRQCVYEVNGKRFMQLFEDCPDQVYVR